MHSDHGRKIRMPTMDLWRGSHVSMAARERKRVFRSVTLYVGWSVWACGTFICLHMCMRVDDCDDGGDDNGHGGEGNDDWVGDDDDITNNILQVYND